MSQFAFRAVDLAGVPSRGEVEAPSKAQVTEQLRQRGLIVLELADAHGEFKVEAVLQRCKSVKTRPLSVLSRQFATLGPSCKPMLQSPHTREDQTQDERLKKANGTLRQDVE